MAIVFLFLAYLRWRYLKRKQRKRKLAEEQRQQHLSSAQETKVQPLSSRDTTRETPTSAPQSFSVDNPLREPKETQQQHQHQQHQLQTVANPLRATKEAQQQQRLTQQKQLPEPAATALPHLPRPQHHWVTKFSTRMDAFYYVNSLTGVSTWVRPAEVESVF